VRTPTPSAAAMAALPDRVALRNELSALWRRLAGAGQDVAVLRRDQLGQAQRSLRMLSPSARLRTQRLQLSSAVRALSVAGQTAGAGARSRFDRSLARLAACVPRTELARTRLAAATGALARVLGRGTQTQAAKLAQLAAQLDSLSPLAVLGRGYAVARRASDGALVSDAEDVAKGDLLEVRLARGLLDTRVERVAAPEEGDED